MWYMSKASMSDTATELGANVGIVCKISWAGMWWHLKKPYGKCLPLLYTILPSIYKNEPFKFKKIKFNQKNRDKFEHNALQYDIIKI